jgi:hypothetical protein
MSARGAAKKPPVRGSSGLSGRVKSTDSTYDDDLRAEHAQLVEDLRQQVQKAEIASEQYQKELDMLQMRLDEVASERNVLEDQISQKDTETEAVQAEAKDIMRQKKEMEQAHYSERAMMLREREQQLTKEQELQSIVQRLNETIRQKEIRAQVEGDRPVMSRSGKCTLYRPTCLVADKCCSKFPQPRFPGSRPRSICTLCSVGEEPVTQQLKAASPKRQDDRVAKTRAR